MKNPLLWLLGVTALWWLQRQAQNQSTIPFMNTGYPGGTFALTLRSQPFETSPGVIVTIPAGYNPRSGIDLVIYYRGNGSCINVIAGDVDGPCRPGGNRHRASHIVSQFIAARKNAVLVIVERLIESSDVSNFGRWRNPTGFTAFTNEIEQFVNEQLNTQARISSLSLYAHSGGWSILAECMRKTNIAIRDVVLLDAFYGDVSTMTRFAMMAVEDNFPQKRFVSIHTGGIPTTNTQQLINNVRLNFPNRVLSQGSQNIPTESDLHHAVYAKYSTISHPDIPIFYFGRVLQSSFLSTIY